MCVKDGEKRCEKWILRKAFDTRDDPYLPDEVLWRQKEQFSDGVGYVTTSQSLVFCVLSFTILSDAGFLSLQLQLDRFS